jgi:hypothetical protein
LKEQHSLSESDEYAHTADEQADWRESYYFNWVDLDTGISGFSTIGLLPNVKKREFVFALFYDEGREVYFNEPSSPFSDDISESLSDGVLSYELTRSLQKWRIIYRGRNIKADIIWPARFPAYDFGKGSGTSWNGHYEQSGAPHGTVTFSDGRAIRISGLGERDKSWGSRDWHIDSWFALHAQFDDLSIGLRRDVVRGEVHSSGGISFRDGHIPVKEVDLTTETEKESGAPVGSNVRIIGLNGEVYSFKSRLITPTSFARFAREFPGGSTELYEGMAIHECKELESIGTGLVEWLYTHLKK